MADIIPFVAKSEQKDPIDDVTMCTITVIGRGDVSLWIADFIETREQHNWLIAKIVAAATSVNERKMEMTSDA